MILIADSGSTKTDWCIGRNLADCRTIASPGINPFHQSTDEIDRLLTSFLWPACQDLPAPTEIHFYGAGCIPEKAPVVYEALHRHFPQADIQVESDLLGAARALCGHKAGIACILGTGSNSCAFDGEHITHHTAPLGYILGDEGSGAVLGKRLVSDCLKRQLPDDLCQALLETYHLTPADILEKVYRQPLANRFLASLTPFLSQHRQRPEIQALLRECFTDFFRRNVCTYPFRNSPLHFTGSIAYYFQEEVREAAQALGLSVGRILRSPLEGLQAYHFPA